MMNQEQATAVLAYINQADPLVQTNDVASEIWWEALKNHEVDQAIWCAKNYYATATPGWNGRVEPLTPAMLRAKILEKKEQAESKRRALEPNRNQPPEKIFRSRDPEKWDKLVALGAQQFREDHGCNDEPETTRGVAPF